MFKNKKLDECRGGFVSKISSKVTWLTERFNRFIIFAISANGRLLFCCSYMFALIGLWSTSSDDFLATWIFGVRAIQFWLLPNVCLLRIFVDSLSILLSREGWWRYWYVRFSVWKENSLFHVEILAVVKSVLFSWVGYSNRDKGRLCKDHLKSIRKSTFGGVASFMLLMMDMSLA